MCHTCDNSYIKSDFNWTLESAYQTNMNITSIIYWVSHNVVLFENVHRVCLCASVCLCVPLCASVCTKQCLLQSCCNIRWFEMNQLQKPAISYVEFQDRHKNSMRFVHISGTKLWISNSLDGDLNRVKINGLF